MKAGREDDAEDLVISEIQDIIEPCQLSIPGDVPDGPDFSSPLPEPIGTTGSQSPRKFLVQWGISADSLKTELQPNDKLRMKTLEIRNLNNPGDKIGIDPSDTLSLQEPFIALNLSCGLGGLSTGFAEAGFNVAVGVETDIAAANSWKVLFLTDKYLTCKQSNGRGCVFTEDIGTFLDKIPVRFQVGEVPKPAILLMSTPEMSILFPWPF
jgi:hypothetical protein